MATLTSTKIKNTYDALLKATDNDAIGSSAKQITDGLGNGTPLYISTTQIGIGVTPEATYDLHVYSNAKVGGNLTVTGDLTVDGTVTTVSSETLTVTDPLIELAKDNTSSDALDIGFYGKYAPSGTTLYAGLFRDTGDSKFKLFKSLEEQPTTTVNTSGTGYTRADLVIGNLEATQINLGDNEQIRSGDSEDLKIYHNGTNSYITNSTGNFEITTTGSLILQDASSNKWMMTNQSGNVLLYNAGSVKLSTSSTGVTVTGTIISDGLDLGDSEKIRLGTGNDLEIYHDGTNASFISNTNTTLPLQIFTDDLDIKSYSLQNNMIVANSGGNVSLYYNGSQKLYTTNTGISITGRISQLTDPSAAQDAATKAYVDAQIGANNELSEVLANGNTTGGTNISVSAGDDIDFSDTSEARFGSDQDLIIKHTGTTGSVTNFVGHLNVVNNANDSDIRFFTDDGVGGITTYLQIDGGVERNIFYKDTKHPDNIVAHFGNGDDLRIQHSSGNNSSYIQNYTGDLIIQNLADDKDIIFQSDDGSGGVTTYYYIDGSEQLNRFQKNILLPDGVNIALGSSFDLQLYHDGGTESFINNTTGNLIIQNTADDSDIIFKSDDGSGGLATYFALDGGITRTVVYKNFNFQDDVKLEMGTGADLQIYHDATNSMVTNSTGDIRFIQNVDDGKIRFYNDNGSGGITEYFRIDGSSEETLFSKQIRVPDSVEIIAGSNSDLQIYHDGSNSYIKDTGTGNLWIQGSAQVNIGGANGEIGIQYVENADVTLRHNNVAKLSTTSTGVKTTGEIVVDGTTGAFANSGITLKRTGVLTGDADILLAGTSGSEALAFRINDSEKVRIDSSGQVGIGTSSPTQPLQILGAGNYDPTSTGGQTTNGILIRGGGTTGDNTYTAGIGFAYGNGTSGISGLQTDGTDQDRMGLAFFTHASGTGTAASSEAMRIEANGSVGIGTDSPVNNLHLNSSGATTLRVSTSSTTSEPQILLIDGSSDYFSIQKADRGITFKPQGAEAMRIDSSGNVGIGTTSPVGDLTIGRNGNASGGNIMLGSTTNATNKYAVITSQSYNSSTDTEGFAVIATQGISGTNLVTIGGGISEVDSATQMRFYTSSSTGTRTGTERMRIDSSGRVGIGTTSPDRKLHILDTNAGAITYPLRLQNSGTTAGTAVGLILTTNTSGGNFASSVIRSVSEDTSGNSALLFSTPSGGSAAERMRIDSSGNVGIGTTSIGKTLTVGGTGLRVQSTASADFYSTGQDALIVNNGTANLRFWNNAAERMRINSSGNVGIGTTSPISKLHVSNSGSQGIEFTPGSGGNINSTQHYNRSTSNYVENRTIANNHTWFNGGTQVATIDGSGNVGIGTSSPSAKLHIENGSSGAGSAWTNADELIIENSGNVGLTLQSPNTAAATIAFQDPESVQAGWIQYLHADNAMRFATNGNNERMRIDSSGNVGIGTDSPEGKLHIKINDSGATPISQQHLILENNSATGIGILTSSSTTGYIFFGDESDAQRGYISYNHPNDRLTFKTGGSERVFIDSSGNVGIGTTTPSRTLQVHATTSQGIARFTSGSTTQAFIDIKDANTTADNKVRFGADTDDLVLWANGERFRITSAGDVGIGTTTPSAKLEVRNDVAASTDLDPTSIKLYNNSDGGSAIEFSNGVSGNSKISFGVESTGAGTDDTFLGFSTGQNTGLSERMRIDSSGNTTFTGNVMPAAENAHNIGSAATRWEDLYVDDGFIRDAYIDEYIYHNGDTNTYIRFTPDTMTFRTAGDDAITIDSNRRVGIGTTLPNQKLDVNGSINITGGTGRRIYWSNGDMAIHNAGSYAMAFETWTGSALTEKMRITSGGSVGIGETNPTYRLNVKSSNNLMHVQDTSGTSNATFVLFSAPSYTPIGSITRNASAGSILYNTSSDYRLKEDLQDFNALDLVDNITAYDYKWKDTEQRDYGFVAHELQEVMPNVVTGEKDGEMMQGVDYSKLTPVLLKAIQELKAEIETLKAQINN